MDDDPPDALTADALRLNDRYVLEVVEAFGVCPFARGARVAGRSAREVLLQSTLDPAPVLAAIERHEQGPESVEVVQLILPDVVATPHAFDDFVAAVRAARAARAHRPAFALAAFHPDLALDASSPDALVPFFRRTPDPTIQLVRVAVLEALSREAGPFAAAPDAVERFLRGEGPPPPSVGAWITRANFDGLQRTGPGPIAAIYTSIAEERSRRPRGG